MPATIAGSHLGPDTHANRPAANAAGQPFGAIYSCTTHGLIYKTDGSTWSTYATLGSGTLSDQGVVTYFDFTTAAAPSSPAAGKVRVYSKTGDHFAQKTSAGVETLLDATGGGSVQYPSLKPATPTYDFAGAALDGAFSAHSSGGSFALANVMTQGDEWGGSAVELQFSIQMGAIYVAHADADFDFTVGGMMLHGAETSSVMFGIAALNSAGTGVGIVAYNDNNAYLATITTWNYSANSSSTGMGHNFVLNAVGYWWMRLKRVSGTWTGYISMSGRAWDFTFTTRADSIVVDRLVFGLLYSVSSTYAGRLVADYFQVDV